MLASFIKIHWQTFHKNLIDDVKTFLIVACQSKATIVVGASKERQFNQVILHKLFNLHAFFNIVI